MITSSTSRPQTAATADAASRAIIFSSFPKSGTYLFWRICRALQLAVDQYTSYSHSTGISGLLTEFIPEEGRPYAHFEELDQLYKDGDEWRLYVHHPMRNLSIDLELMLERSSLLWLHEPPSVIDELCGDRKRFYVMRDGRSVVNSLIHHFTRPSVRATHPTYTIDDPLELYRRKDNFRKYVCIWRDHVAEYLANPEEWFLVRFEDIKSDVHAQVRRMAAHLDIDCDCEAIAREFDFDRMKAASPTHVRAGTNEDWRNYFDNDHIEIFKEEAGQMLVDLGYAQDLDW